MSVHRLSNVFTRCMWVRESVTVLRLAAGSTMLSAEWSDEVRWGPIGSRWGPMGSDWVISHTDILGSYWKLSGRKVFRIGTVRYNWPMSAHASQAFSTAHCTDSEDLPSGHRPELCECCPGRSTVSGIFPSHVAFIVRLQAASGRLRVGPDGF